MIGIGERLFSLALRLLPGTLRETWGDDLLLTFRAKQERVRSRWGGWALPGLWVRELLGMLHTAVRARRPDRWTRATRTWARTSHARRSDMLTPDAQESDPRVRSSKDDSTTMGGMMGQALADIRHAARTFRRRPGMIGLALVSLALGIGASTAMFSVVDSVLLRPLPFDEPGELVNVYRADPELVGHPQYGAWAMRGVFSEPEFWWVAENQRVFASMGGFYSWGGTTLSGEGRPERLSVIRASPGLLPTLGVEPIRGRAFGPDDDPAAGGRSVMLTESFWESRFARDPGVVGSELILDDQPATVVGILSDEVEEATAPADVWSLFSGSSADGNWGNHSLTGVVARLRDGVTLEQASDEVARLMGSVPEANRHGHAGAAYAALDDNTRQVRPALLLLIAGAFVLLAVGCGNVAAILVGAGIDREAEIAVRSALGAGRGRLVRQLLAEGAALSMVGAVGGLVVAYLAMEGLLLLAPPDLPRIDGASLDGRVLGFTLSVSVAAGILFGMVPALGLSRPDIGAAMTTSGTRGTTGRHGRVQSALVVGELALATVLLVAGALLGRTLFALEDADLGLDADGLYAVRMAPAYQRFGDTRDSTWTAAIDGYFQEILDAVEAVPGVSEAAVTTNVPLTGDRNNNNLTPEGWDPEMEGEELIAERRYVSDDYIETTGIRLVEGRDFDASDNRQGAAPVMIISEGLARRVWPGEPAVGKRISFFGRDPSTVVGVVADLRDESLRSRTPYAFYVPARQMGPQAGSILARITAAPEAVLPAVRQAIWDVDPDLPITRIASMEELVSEAASQHRYRARLMIVFALLAAVFAMTGVYGVTARSVARRTQEMGIRVALGAERGDVLSLVLKQGARLALWGGLIGVGMAWFATAWLEDMLFDVGRQDPISIIGPALLVGLVSILASLPPGRRATRVDPIDALRAE